MLTSGKFWRSSLSTGLSASKSKAAFSLTKEYVDRPTYDDLMDTDFYKYYSSLADKEEDVKRYVERMLLVADNWEVV